MCVLSRRSHSFSPREQQREIFLFSRVALSSQVFVCVCVCVCLNIPSFPRFALYLLSAALNLGVTRMSQLEKSKINTSKIRRNITSEYIINLIAHVIFKKKGIKYFIVLRLIFHRRRINSYGAITLRATRLRGDVAFRRLSIPLSM